MTKLIELNDSNRGDMPREVTHLVEVPLREGDPLPPFAFCPILRAWFAVRSPGKAATRTVTSGWTHARAATPAEIASQAQPSEVVVSREDLQIVCDYLGRRLPCSAPMQVVGAYKKLDAALSGKAVRE